MTGDTSAEQLAAFLARVTFEEARLDLLPTTDVELTMLGRTRA